MRKILLLLRPENTEEENCMYAQAICNFGGEVVTVCDNDKEKDIIPILEKVDGILLPGGYKVGKLDFYLISYAVKKHLRLLGICQGMQSMALWQSSDTLIEIGNLSHERSEGYAHFVLLKESRLQDILKSNKISVNSHHLQTIRNSQYFSIVGKAEDGLIEAIENTTFSFQIGVQWHPERMLSYDEYSQKLMSEFIKGV